MQILGRGRGEKEPSSSEGPRGGWSKVEMGWLIKAEESEEITVSYKPNQDCKHFFTFNFAIFL